MKRKKAEADLTKLIHDLGWDWKKFEDKRVCPRCRNVLYRVDNRPYDGMATIHGVAIPIEVKMGHTRFPFSDLKEHQREGMREWQIKHSRQSWLFLQMGDDRPNSKSETRRRCWLVTLSTLEGVEDLCGAYGLKSLPLNEHTTKRINVKKDLVYATNLLYNHELPWMPGGWKLPHEHLFSKIYNVYPEGAEL